MLQPAVSISAVKHPRALLARLPAVAFYCRNCYYAVFMYDAGTCEIRLSIFRIPFQGDVYILLWSESSEQRAGPRVRE